MSTSFTSSCLNQFDWISNYGPSFVIPASNFDILYEPSHFFDELNNIFVNAKQRVYISSLYFGTDPFEYKLIDSLQTALDQNPSLHVVVLLDYIRGHRFRKHQQKAPSKEVFLPLIEKYPSRVDFYLFHTPLLYGLCRAIFPSPFDEAFGAQHMKIYIADDTLIISGANLNKTYFTNRGDRYLKIKSCQSLCEFFIDLIDAVVQQSFKVEANQDEVRFMGEYHPFEGDNAQYCTEMEETISSLIKSYQIEYPKPQKLSKDDVLVVPLIQMGTFKIHNDRDFNIYLYSHLPMNSKLYFAASYFNITQEYEKELINNKRTDTKIYFLTASPQANSFYGNSGLASYIPAGYTENEREFIERAEKICGNNDEILMFEYHRPQWTYHAKGLWLYEEDKTFPTLICVGSTNFSARSIDRDLEAQLAIVTDNEELREKFHRERTRLFEYGTLVTAKALLDPSRIAPLWLRLLMRFIRTFF